MGPAMSFSIDPARRPPRIRRTAKSAAELADGLEGASAAQPQTLPIPVGRARTVPPKTPLASAAQIEAQMIGERRGLRAGAAAIDQAKVTYNRTEWSGAKDRRAPKGRAAKTEV
jgi:hypothetical protein